MNKKVIYCLISILMLIMCIMLSGCHDDGYNDTLRIETTPIQAMVVANYCIEGEIRPVDIGGVTVQRYFPPEYYTIVQYDEGSDGGPEQFRYLELTINSQKVYEAVQIGDYLECNLITEIFENGRSQRLEYVYKVD